MPPIRRSASKPFMNQHPPRRNPGRDPRFPKGYKDPFPGVFGTGPICRITSHATAAEIEDDIKLIMASPYYGLNGSILNGGFANTVEGTVSKSTTQNPPLASTYEKDTAKGLNTDEEMEMMVTRLMDVVSTALASSVSPRTTVCPRPPISSPSSFIRPTNPLKFTLPSPVVLAFSITIHSPYFLVPPPTVAASHPLVIKTSPTVPPSLNPTRPRRAKTAYVTKKLRLPPKVRDASTFPRNSSNKVSKPKPLRGAGKKIYINRESYRSSTAIPRAAPAQIPEAL